MSRSTARSVHYLVPKLPMVFSCAGIASKTDNTRQSRILKLYHTLGPRLNGSLVKAW